MGWEMKEVAPVKEDGNGDCPSVKVMAWHMGAPELLKMVTAARQSRRLMTKMEANGEDTGDGERKSH